MSCLSEHGPPLSSIRVVIGMQSSCNRRYGHQPRHQYPVTVRILICSAALLVMMILGYHVTPAGGYSHEPVSRPPVGHFRSLLHLNVVIIQYEYSLAFRCGRQSEIRHAISAQHEERTISEAGSLPRPTCLPEQTLLAPSADDRARGVAGYIQGQTKVNTSCSQYEYTYGLTMWPTVRLLALPTLSG
ncbi:hypothetical protein V8C26DRAFT_150876 [Trichoderma gracile]